MVGSCSVARPLSDAQPLRGCHRSTEMDGRGYSERFTAWIAIRDGRNGEQWWRFQLGQRYSEGCGGEHDRGQARLAGKRKNRHCWIEKKRDGYETDCPVMLGRMECLKGHDSGARAYRCPYGELITGDQMP